MIKSMTVQDTARDVRVSGRQVDARSGHVFNKLRTWRRHRPDGSFTFGLTPMTVVWDSVSEDDECDHRQRLWLLDCDSQPLQAMLVLS
jgi:hypothetical protein